MKDIKRGFTLIELMVVISVISLLSSVVLASFQAARVSARDSQRVSNLHQLDLAVNMYKGDHNDSVPNFSGSCSASHLSDAVNCVANSSGGNNWTAFSGELQPYIAKLPSSLNGIDYIYLPPAAMGAGATDSSYQLSVKLEKTGSLVGYTTNTNSTIITPPVITFSATGNGTLASAGTYCAGSIGGVAGWRLPSSIELKSAIRANFGFNGVTPINYGFIANKRYWGNDYTVDWGGFEAFIDQTSNPNQPADVKCIKP